MLESFTVDTFAPHRDDTFVVEGALATPLSLTLSEVTPLGDGTTPAGSTRMPFALHFTGPLSTFLPQHTYRLTHPALGTFDLFLVPLGPGAGRYRYEAIFT